LASAHGDLNTSREKKENTSISEVWEKKEFISEVWGEVSCCGLCRAKQ
jgi:hypothetical protein